MRSGIDSINLPTVDLDRDSAERRDCVQNQYRARIAHCRSDFFNPLPPDDRAAAKREVIDLLEPILKDETGLWIADYVRLRFRATLSG